MNSIRIINWNILAPELMMYFWRSSYGLKITDDPSYYDHINRERIDNIIKYLSTSKADLICLQEVTNQTYTYLNHKTIQQYIADQLDYIVISQSFKNSPFEADYPPHEQQRKLKMDSGVATLLKKDSQVTLEENLAIAKDFGKSKIFNSGVGSPFTLDKFRSGRYIFYLCNVHVRMEYPHILRPLNEIYQRISTILSAYQLKKTLVMGDFNASGLIPAKDLFISDFYRYMFDERGHELIDDHIFIGHLLRQYQMSVKYDHKVPLLEMNVNQPTSNPKMWSQKSTPYQLSKTNNALVDAHQVTTDHPPIEFQLTFKKVVRKSHQLGGKLNCN